MKPVRVLIGKQDGEPDRLGEAFDPGSMASSGGKVVPVLLDHDHRASVGKATIVIEGENVYADLDLTDGADVEEVLYPSVGGVVRKSTDNGPSSIRTIFDFEILSVGVHRSPNADARVPPVRIALRRR